MSSFVRAGKGGSKLAPGGTRPGLHGRTLISTGLADLDHILSTKFVSNLTSGNEIRPLTFEAPFITDPFIFNLLLL